MSKLTSTIAELKHKIGTSVVIRGWLHTRRDLGGVRFGVLRDTSGIAQCVFDKSFTLPLAESCLAVSGKVVANKRAPGGLEIQAENLEVISEAKEPTPIEIPKTDWNVNPETILDYRHVSLREPKARAVLKVQAELVKSFRAYLDSQGFTEIFTPKIVSAGAEGGAKLFEVDYYDKRAFLAQSPQLYKQIMVAVYEKVFETAPVYRAELSRSSRHLSEYLSLDVEIAFIKNASDIMDLQEGLFKYLVKDISEKCSPQLELLKVTLPSVETNFPRITLLEARKIVAERYGHKTGGKDLDPEAERLITKWAKEEHNSDFVFITHYPQAARPFYTYPIEDGLTRGLDLIFKGLEITSGGQRIHDYDVLVEELKKRKMDPADFKGYLEIFKHGMPPHGGFAIGAERLTALLLGIDNIRFARAFPRDEGRLQP